MIRLLEIDLTTEQANEVLYTGIGWVRVHELLRKPFIVPENRKPTEEMLDDLWSLTFTAYRKLVTEKILDKMQMYHVRLMKYVPNNFIGEAYDVVYLDDSLLIWDSKFNAWVFQQIMDV